MAQMADKLESSEFSSDEFANVKPDTIRPQDNMEQAMYSTTRSPGFCNDPVPQQAQTLMADRQISLLTDCQLTSLH